MLRAYTADQVRAAEEPLLAAGVPLMARAAVALECAVVEELRGRSGSAPLARAGRVLVLVGSGNNGGDGLFAAAGLARRGVDVAVVLLGSRPHPAGLAAARATGARVRDLSGLAPAPVQDEVPGLLEGPRVEVIVDAITGIGVTGGLRGVPGAVVATLRSVLEVRAVGERPIVVAVDVPSGIGVDDGTVPGPVLPADRTVTMGVAKTGLLLPPAAGVSGRVDVVNLGLEAELTGVAPTLTRLTSAEVAHSVPVPGSGSDKYRRGVVGVLAGSAAYPGAAVLACEGAAPLAGMVRYVGPERAENLVLGLAPGGRVWCGSSPGLGARVRDRGRRRRPVGRGPCGAGRGAR
ncbi:NAD(P)H-hydrate epimerase [Salana multivorans]